MQRLKPLRGGESRVATVKDSLWLYDNDNEDEDYAAKLRGESACGTGKATKVAVKEAMLR